MTTDLKYLNKYKPNQLYIIKTDGTMRGKFITVVNEIEELIGELQISPKIKLAITATYIDEKKDIKGYKIRKFKDDTIIEQITLNDFGVNKISEFNKLIQKLDLQNATNIKISLSQQFNIDSLLSILDPDKFSDLLNLLKKDPRLTIDVFALSHKKEALIQFKRLLDEKPDDEKIWQTFFEENSWIFGHGLNYIFLDKVYDKLEQTTTGHTHQNSGKRIDALMKTKALISQYVLIEIKKPGTPLLKFEKPYRPGCWQPSSELSGAVAQSQKTAFEFIRQQTSIKDQIKDNEGKYTGEEVFKISPKTYLICGKLDQILHNEDQIKSFELYRNSIISPEILTYDELYMRAECIIKNLTHQSV